MMKPVPVSFPFFEILHGIFQFVGGGTSKSQRENAMPLFW